LHDAGLGEWATGKAGEDEGFLRADIVEYTEDFDLKFVYTAAGENGAAGASHAGFEVLEGKDRSLGGKPSGERENRRNNEAGHTLL
jgi:hypothetical protein